MITNTFILCSVQPSDAWSDERRSASEDSLDGELPSPPACHVISLRVDHDCTRLQPSDASDSGRREINMAEVNEESLDGELPFLARSPAEAGKARRRTSSAADGLPTHHEALLRKSSGFLGRRWVIAAS